jgi:hypothetical protein
LEEATDLSPDKLQNYLMNNSSEIEIRLLLDPFYVSMNACETSVGCSLANRDLCMCLTAVQSRTTRFCLEILTRQNGWRI